MPTESAFLLAGLLFIAAALGWAFARFGESEDEADLPSRLSSDYLKGLNYVLNEEPDRAVELFTRMAELDDEALETHFALGSLFRKRGEVDRAIRVHQNLMARPGLDQAHRDQAEAALAEDYLSAGIFDRAETLFLKLRDSKEFQALALQRLVRIYERTHEWERAIEAQAALDEGRRERLRQAPQGAQVAHYYCELAEQARAEHDIETARAMLRKADDCRVPTVRSMLARADLDRAMGKGREAMRGYEQVIHQSPGLLVDVLPRAAACCREADDEEMLSHFLQTLLDVGDEHIPAIAIAVIRHPEIDHALAAEALVRYVEADPTLRKLVGVERIRALPAPERASSLHDVRDALRSILASHPGYHCHECGYGCLALQWQCPGCRSWETVMPETRLKLG